MPTLRMEQIRQLSDHDLDELAWQVQAEQERRRKLRQPRSFVEDIRHGLDAPRTGGEES
jgi:hypothetical protein